MNTACSTPACLVTVDEEAKARLDKERAAANGGDWSGVKLTTPMKVIHCRHHEAGPKALLLLRSIEDYLKSLRSSPQRDRYLREAQALLTNAGVR